MKSSHRCGHGLCENHVPMCQSDSCCSLFVDSNDCCKSRQHKKKTSAHQKRQAIKRGY